MYTSKWQDTLSCVDLMSLINSMWYRGKPPLFYLMKPYLSTLCALSSRPHGIEQHDCVWSEGIQCMHKTTNPQKVRYLFHMCYHTCTCVLYKHACKQHLPLRLWLCWCKRFDYVCLIHVMRMILNVYIMFMDTMLLSWWSETCRLSRAQYTHTFSYGCVAER